MATAAEATTRAQQTLALERSDLVPDGKWGRFTQTAYDNVTPGLRARVDTELSALGYSAVALRSARMVQKSEGAVAVGNATEVKDIVRAVSSEKGIPEATLLGFAKIESNFNPKAVNGSSRGLMQIQPAAWQTAASIDPSIGSYDNVWDTRKNAEAGAALMKANGRTLRKLGYTGELTPEVLYMAHQQGAAGFIELWRASEGLPSMTSYVTVKAMSGNPPQDGLGVTTDKSVFLKRWLAAARRKMFVA